MMQASMEMGIREQELLLDVDDVERMRRAFHGIHVDPRRQTLHRVHLESGEALLTDGSRLHTIPVKYKSSVAIDVDLTKMREAWQNQKALRVRPSYSSDTFLKWRELIPKANVGVLCDMEVWLPALASIRGWGWSTFSFYKHETVIRPLSTTNPGMTVNLSHLMYKGKNVAPMEQRVLNPQYIFDVFRNADDLGDTRVFVCFVAQNLMAPLLCRGNNSSLLALVLARK